MRVRTVMPSTPGDDFNDVLVARRVASDRSVRSRFRFIVVDETEPEQRRHRQRRASRPSADDGRKVLRDILDEIVTQALDWHEALERCTSPRIAKTRPTAPSRSRPASASRNLAGRQSPGSSSRPGAEDCLTVFCTPCRRIGWRTRRAARCRTASPRRSGKAAKAPSSAPTSRCAAISRRSRPRSRSARRSKRPSASTRRRAARSTTLATIRRRRRQPKRPMSCSRRTKSCFQMAKALGKNFGLVVVDEGFWQDGITGTRLAIARLDHELEAFPVRDYDGAAKSTPRPTHLRDLIERLQARAGRTCRTAMCSARR